MDSLIEKYINSHPKSKENPSINAIFKPMYILLSILGLFPLSFRYNKANNRFIVKKKSLFFNVLKSLLILVLICTFFVFNMIHMFTRYAEVAIIDVFISNMNYILELFLLFVFCGVAYCSAVLNRQRYVKMLDTAASAWADMPFLPRSLIPRRLRIEVHFVVMGALLLILILHLALNFTREDDKWTLVLATFTLILSHIVQFVEIAYIYVMVHIVATIMKNIAEYLAKYTKPKSDNEVFWRAKGKSSPPGLRQIQMTLSKAHDMVNDITESFQGAIMLTSLQCFHALVSETHSIYHGAVITKKLTIHQLVMSTFWAIYQVIKIHVLGRCGELLKSEHQNILEIIHDIPIEEHDHRVLLEIQHFSSQMHFQDMELTVYGYFPVDATLLYNIFTAGMMYLIIFVQFDTDE